MSKKIYLELPGKMHSYWRSLIDYPPEGYEFVVGGTGWDKMLSPVVNNDWLYFKLASWTRKPWMPSLPLLKARLEGTFKKRPQNAVLTYAWNHLVFRKEPWVLDIERLFSLTSFNMRHLRKAKGLIEATLSSPWCKRVLCWTEFTKQEILSNVDATQSQYKMEVVYRAVPARAFSKDYADTGKIKLLFVGTANEPGAFLYKGGMETLECFVRLRQKYPHVALTIRSDIPKEVKDKYEGIEGLRMIEGALPWALLEKEFQAADVFLFPTHITPCSVFLDAMSYELPVVTVNQQANSEIIEDGKTGFAVRRSRYVRGNMLDIASKEDQFENWRQEFQQVDPQVVAELVEKTSNLIEDPELRKRMGKRGRWEVEEGRFSIRRRNRELARVFDEVLAEKQD